MVLTFQVPMQYCSLQHQTLLLSSVTPTAGYCFCLGSIPSFFLELFLHWSPVAYWVPTDLGCSSFSILSFCLFILFMEFSKQEYWSDLPFPSPVDHILSDLSIMSARLGWPHRAWLSFIELDKAVILVWLDWLVFCDYDFSVSALWCPLTTYCHSMFKVRRGGDEEIPLVQGKEQQLHFAGAAVKRYPMFKVRETYRYGT